MPSERELSAGLNYSLEATDTLPNITQKSSSNEPFQINFDSFCEKLNYQGVDKKLSCSKSKTVPYFYVILQFILKPILALSTTK